MGWEFTNIHSYATFNDCGEVGKGCRCHGCVLLLCGEFRSPICSFNITDVDLIYCLVEQLHKEIG